MESTYYVLYNCLYRFLYNCTDKQNGHGAHKYYYKENTYNFLIMHLTLFIKQYSHFRVFFINDTNFYINVFIRGRFQIDSSLVSNEGT